MIQIFFFDFCLFVWVEALHPSQKCFSHVGTEPPLPGYYQYFLRVFFDYIQPTFQKVGRVVLFFCIYMYYRVIDGALV